MKKNECNWSQEDEDCYDSTYYTDCSESFVLNDGTPSENGMKYCCYCGKKLTEYLYVKDGDEEDLTKCLNQ